MKKTREERIREYAWIWYQFRMQNGCKGTAEGDWKKAEHIVDSEDTMTQSNSESSSHEYDIK